MYLHLYRNTNTSFTSHDVHDLLFLDSEARQQTNMQRKPSTRPTVVNQRQVEDLGFYVPWPLLLCMHAYTHTHA